MDSNTTLVKVKFIIMLILELSIPYSNTTLVKVKLRWMEKVMVAHLYSNTTLVKVKFVLAKHFYKMTV